MIWVWVMLSIFTAANGVWLYLNWRDRQRIQNEVLQISAQRHEAMLLLQQAKDSQNEMPHRVCAECNRIVARYSVENGFVICPNCAMKLARANG
jgi:hypothetical protein